MKAPVKPTLHQRIAEILIQLQTRWDRLNNTQRTQWNAYADFRLLSCTDAPVPPYAGMLASLNARQYFIVQNFYRVFYGPLNGLGKDPVMYTPIFAPSETMEVWGPKGEWSNKDIIRYPFPLDIKKHIAIIWESAPVAESTPLTHATSLLRLMSFTSLNGRDQDTTIPYREQFSRLPKPGEFIFAKVGFANKLTGVLSNFILQKQKVVPNP